MLRLSVLMLILVGAGLSAWTQQPFFTDDANVTSKGRFHFELSNQFSFLQDGKWLRFIAVPVVVLLVLSAIALSIGVRLGIQ